MRNRKTRRDLQQRHGDLRTGSRKFPDAHYQIKLAGRILSQFDIAGRTGRRTIRRTGDGRGGLGLHEGKIRPYCTTLPNHPHPVIPAMRHGPMDNEQSCYVCLRLVLFYLRVITSCWSVPIGVRPSLYNYYVFLASITCKKYFVSADSLSLDS